MKPATLAVVLTLALSGCATLEERANTGAVADGATTLGAVALGAAEMNPLGLATVVIKWPLLEYVKTLPADEQAAFHAVAGPVWSGAAVNNACVIVALLSAGTFAPACLLGGIGYGIWAWHESAPEREFMAFCEEYKRWSGETLPCVYQLSARADADAR